MKSFPYIDETGTIRFMTEDGQLHREGDKPSLIGNCGSVIYHQYGLTHRDGGKPAVIYKSNSKAFYRYGEEYFLRD